MADERREGQDRRSGRDRRKLCFGVAVDRRAWKERRSGRDRRAEKRSGTMGAEKKG